MYSTENLHAMPSDTTVVTSCCLVVHAVSTREWHPLNNAIHITVETQPWLCSMHVAGLLQCSLVPRLSPAFRTVGETENWMGPGNKAT